MSRVYTVREVADMAGISVRALHHYDEIGLLRPAYTGDNRYRYYGEAELLRLQQILLHRELDIPLNEIGAILDAPGFDRLAALQQQRERIAAQAKRYAGLVRTIDRTIARLKGESAMVDADLYGGVVSPQKQAEYEQWLIEHYGLDMEADIARSRKALAGRDMAAAMAELEPIEQGLAEAMRRGLPPQSTSLDALIERHRAWIAMAWGRDCPPEAYAGLADVYEHPDFRKRYEAIAAGFAEYLVTAMRAWARRQA